MGRSASLQDDISHDGLWWLPDKPDDRIAGQLTFSQLNGARLKLIGSFGGFASFNRDLGEEVVIHGLTIDGKRISLLGAVWTQRQLRTPGIMTSEFRAAYICIGHHFRSENEALFSKGYYRFERLEEWLGAQPFEQTWTDDPSRLALQVDRKPSEELCRFADRAIGKAADLYTDDGGRTQFAVYVNSYLYCEADGARDLIWHLTTASRLQGLASLCTGHYLPHTHFALELHQPDQDTRQHSQLIEIFWEMQHPEAGSRPKHEHPLFSARELLAANSEAIERWFEQYEALDPAINLYFAVTGEKQMFVNVRFLLAVQALEVFHRRTAPGGMLASAEFKAIRKRLVDAIPEDLAPAMVEKLRGLYAFANEPSLMNRLTEVIAEIDADFGESVPGFSGSFAVDLRDTRNYYTHFTSALEKKALESGDMYWACRRLVLMLTYLFLKQIGISAPAFRECLDSHREFRSLFSKSGDPF